MSLTTAHNPILTIHLQTCWLHGTDQKPICSGTWKRKGGSCTNNATGPLETGTMPLCKTHKDQRKQSSWCREKLRCGFECGRICVWIPHGYQLCYEHYECPNQPCYFFKVPKEIRFRIYGLLLPDKTIPARFSSSGCLTSTGEPVRTRFLRTNRQIHEEASYLLYTGKSFTIVLDSNALTMCNSPKAPNQALQGYYSGNNHALQDYQMQLMLLEQQNKKRLMMARQEQQSMVNSGSSSSQPLRVPTKVLRFYESTYTLPVGNNVPTIGPSETFWSPPLSINYFNMIQSFIVEIVFPLQSVPDIYGNISTNRSAEQQANVLEKQLYSYCDILHKLIGRFQIVPHPLMHLQISINFGKTDMNRDEVLSIAQVLLRPIQRLRRVERLDTPTILVTVSDDQEINLLIIPTSAMSLADWKFNEYLISWSGEISSSVPLCDSPIFEAFWKLEGLVSSIKKRHVSARFFRFTELLHSGRVAREADDLASFREVLNSVVDIWYEYVNEQMEFQASASLSIDDIQGMLEVD